MDHALNDVKNQMILITIAASLRSVFNQRSFTHRIGVNHHEEVGWSQWCRFWPIVRRKVPCTIVMTSLASEHDHVLLDSHHTQEFSLTDGIILHRCLSLCIRRRSSVQSVNVFNLSWGFSIHDWWVDRLMGRQVL